MQIFSFLSNIISTLTLLFYSVNTRIGWQLNSILHIFLLSSSYSLYSSYIRPLSQFGQCPSTVVLSTWCSSCLQYVASKLNSFFHNELQHSSLFTNSSIHFFVHNLVGPLDFKYAPVRPHLEGFELPLFPGPQSPGIAAIACYILI